MRYAARGQRAGAGQSQSQSQVPRQSKQYHVSCLPCPGALTIKHEGRKRRTLDLASPTTSHLGLFFNLDITYRRQTSTDIPLQTKRTQSPTPSRQKRPLVQARSAVSARKFGAFSTHLILFKSADRITSASHNPARPKGQSRRCRIRS
jgi:hypothetical protein